MNSRSVRPSPTMKGAFSEDSIRDSIGELMDEGILAGTPRADNIPGGPFVDIVLSDPRKQAA